MAETLTMAITNGYEMTIKSVTRMIAQRFNEQQDNNETICRMDDLQKVTNALFQG